MKRLIAIVLCIMLTACAGMSTSQQPATSATAPTAPPETVTLTLPNWPMVAYAKTPEEAFVLLIVKDPKSFPLPLKITFNKADGTAIVMPMLQPDPKVPK